MRRHTAISQTGMVRLRDIVLRPLDLVLAPTCAGCGLPGPGICAGCQRACTAPAPPSCRRCGHPWAVWTDRCAECPARVDRLVFAAPYTGPMPAIVSALKDRRRPALAAELAGLVTARVAPPPTGAVLVPVPLAHTRGRERGYNQAALLARALSARWQVPTVECLERRRDGPPQRGASATDRVRNVRGAFRAPAATPEHVWLVDDVCTTGATLSACARALRRAGTRRVDAVCVARVLQRG